MIEVSQEHTVAVVFHKLMYHCDLVCLLFCILAVYYPLLFCRMSNINFISIVQCPSLVLHFPFRGTSNVQLSNGESFWYYSLKMPWMLYCKPLCALKCICLLKYTVKIYRLLVECFEGWGCSSVFRTLAAQTKVPGFDLQQLNFHFPLICL